MAISHIATASVSAALAINPVPVSIPATATAGRLIVIGMHAGTSATFVTPAGWTAQTFTDAAAIRDTIILWKIAIAGDAGSTLNVNTGTTTAAKAGFISIFDGLDSTTPVVGTIANPTTITMSAAAIAAPSVTTAVADEWMSCWVWSITGSPYTSPGTMTELLDAAGVQSTGQVVAIEARPTAGATGTRSFTFAASQTTAAAFSLRLNPAVGGGAAASLVIPTETVFTMLRRR